MGGRGLGWSVTEHGKFGVSSEHGNGPSVFIKKGEISRLYDEILASEGLYFIKLVKELCGSYK